MEQVLWTLLPTKAGPGSMCYWFRQILHRNKVNIQGSTGLWSGPLHRALFPNGPPERIPGYQKISLQHDIRDELSLISFDRTEGVTPGACSPDYLLPAALSCLDVLRKLMLVETESLLVFF
uniref:Uncharacterized protein n=1 Tax=Arundo donax TaxID=35708 RepID=A0A0A8XTX7_ARUDO